MEHARGYVAETSNLQAPSFSRGKGIHPMLKAQGVRTA
jgi:hypothetical protein